MCSRCPLTDCRAPQLHFSSSARPDLLGDLILPMVTCLLDCVQALIRGILSFRLQPEPSSLSAPFLLPSVLTLEVVCCRCNCNMRGSNLNVKAVHRPVCV